MPSCFGAIFSAAALRAAVVRVVAAFLAVVVFFAAVFLAVVVRLAAVFLAAVAVSVAVSRVSWTASVMGVVFSVMSFSSSGLSSASGRWAEFSVWKAA